MKNIFKVALLSIVCSGSTFASDTMTDVILKKVTTSGTSTKGFNTDPKKKNPILNDKNATDIFIENNTDSYLAVQLINVASENLGTSYRAGGTTAAGFDCSGLMYSTFKKFDITLPRSSYEMAYTGTVVEQNQAKKGDLIFFINRGQSRINHVGMIVEVNDGVIKFIHSSTNGGVIISSLKESYYDRTFKQINRIIQ
ncbi:C40 family peptidase [Flavobacterium sp.]|uniref:C40 family peptidase n=1 Tax=Flavobacterium sp. TaxID=239 RepID=UPI0025E4191C|nr:C40 family peptidase [Flavobacterium sp.]